MNQEFTNAKDMRAYRNTRAFIAPICRWLYGMRVEGSENEPDSGPIIVCANHTSNHDAIILGVAICKMQLRYFAKASLFKVPILKSIVHGLGAFPVDKTTASSSLAAIKNSLALLKQGESLSMFPQGHRIPSKDPRDTQPMSGIGMIVYRSKCRVLPVCIQTKHWRTGFFRRTYVRIGKPIEYEDFSFEKGGSAEFTAASELVFSKINELIKD